MAVAAAMRALIAALAVVGAANGGATAERELRQEGTRMLAAPNAPTNVQAVPALNVMSPNLPLVLVSWAPPAGGDPTVLAYRVYVNDVLASTVNNNVNQPFQAKITNLVIGQRYKFAVAAVNADGESPRAEVYQWAVVAPDPPRNPQAVPGDGWIDVYWDAPLDDGGSPAINYFVLGFQFTTNQTFTLCNMTSITTCRMPNVVNNEVYQFTVYAVSNLTNPFLSLFTPTAPLFAPSAAVEAMAIGLPSGPRRFRFVSGSGYTATLAWDPPLEPGPNPIVGYEISWAQYIYPEQPLIEPFQNPWVTVRVPPNQLQYQVTGLTPGFEWKFGIQAYTDTSIGGMTWGPLYLSANTYQTLGPPGRPSNVAIVGMASGAVKLMWEPPGNEGNAAIKSYRITLTPTSGDLKRKRDRKPIVVECTAEEPNPQCAGEYIVTGLKDGTTYSVAVAAKNRFGWGKSSLDPVQVLTEPSPGQPPSQTTKPSWNTQKSNGRARA